MERIKLLIFLLILIVAVLLMIKYWKTGRKN
ncbi:MAG: hypothetical protein FD181_1898 [Prolixibacteraceae bacterium]|nr:MAG: hypothetical protein FD181_1898 [Prolixibacteraceae bacterium]